MGRPMGGGSVWRQEQLTPGAGDAGGDDRLRAGVFTEIRQVRNAFLLLRRQRTVLRTAGAEFRFSRSSSAEFGREVVGPSDGSGDLNPHRLQLGG